MLGDPQMVSSCCCTRCQRRTGSFFGVTAYFRPDQMAGVKGETATFHRPDGETTFHFCPRCGSSLWWVPDDEDDVIGLSGGAFSDPAFPAPSRMVWIEHRHPFVRTADGLTLFEGGPE